MNEDTLGVWILDDIKDDLKIMDFVLKRYYNDVKRTLESKYGLKYGELENEAIATGSRSDDQAMDPPTTPVTSR